MPQNTGTLFVADVPLLDPNYGTNIYKLIYTDTPFQAGLKSTEKAPTQPHHSWEVEAFGNQGNMAVAQGVSKTSGWGNYVGSVLQSNCQINRSQGWIVTRTTQASASSTVSKQKQLGRQILKDAENMKLAREMLDLSTQETQDAVGSVTPGLLRAAFVWVQPTAQAIYPVPTEYRPTSAMQLSVSSFTEDQLQAAGYAAYSQIRGPVNLTGICGVSVKQNMVGFKYKSAIVNNAAQATLHVNTDQADKKHEVVCDIFVYPWGEITTYLSPYLAWDLTNAIPTAYTQTSAIFYNPSMWSEGWLRPLQPFPQIDNGEGPHGYHEEEGLIVCRNPQGTISCYANV
jgi:hypothetical protein